MGAGPEQNETWGRGWVLVMGNEEMELADEDAFVGEEGRWQRWGEQADTGIYGGGRMVEGSGFRGSGFRVYGLGFTGLQHRRTTKEHEVLSLPIHAQNP